ncbi:RAB6-interacting golgin isoform X1 [Bombina bombina]|uniref:RAB6-interacting golgin isoform X1 n=1 Tax=Bombina bombina TaxID=8345 RepID=UPI00235A9851|nr:RAB6-interacting golgin isoform X1 [Bombina bombina]
MGTTFAPSYANLYVNAYEHEYIWNNNPFIENILKYGRYIDDIIILWQGDISKLDNFVSHMNANSYNLKFTKQTSQTSIEFLDLVLFTSDNSNNEKSICVKNYRKPTERNGYIEATSAHKKCWINNVPYSQFLRIRRNCTHSKNYEEEADILESKFLAKGYDANNIKLARQKAGTKDRQDLISLKQKDAPDRINSNECIRFTTTFSEGAGAIKSIINKHWSILKADPLLGPHLQEKANISYRKGMSLKNYLAPSKMRSKPDNKNKVQETWLSTWKGTLRCSKSRCTMCPHVERSKFFSNSSKTNHYEIDFKSNCESTYVVYLLNCGCGLMYVGRTKRQVRRRACEHIYNIKEKLIKHNVAKHFFEYHNSDPASLKIQVIGSIPPSKHNRLLELRKLETYWIYKLMTLHPQGLNIDIDVAAYM